MKRMMAFLFASMVVGGSTLIGCSDDTSNNTSGDPPTPLALEDLAPTMADTFCELAFSCCTAMEQAQVFEGFPTLPKTAAECVPSIKAQFEMFILAGLKEGVDAGRLKYDATLAGSCVGKIEGQCSALLQDGPFDGGGCEKVFVGLVANGGDCAQGNECASADSTCVIAQGEKLGKCQAIPKEGEACPGFVCADGFVCGSVNMMDVCVKPKADGEACSSSIECVSEYCDFTGGKCGQKKALGDACTTSYECKDAYCEAQMKVCTKLKAPGETCASFDECQNFECTDAMKCAAAPPACDGM